MKDRIIALLENEQITASKLASIIDVQPSAISHILSMRNKPSYDFIVKLINAFPQYNIEWLLLGTGPMLKNEVNQKESFSQKKDGVADFSGNIKTEDCDINLNTDTNVSKSVDNKYEMLTGDVMHEKQKNDVISIPAKDFNNNEPIKDSNVFDSNEITNKHVIEKQQSLSNIILCYDDKTFELYTPR